MNQETIDKKEEAEEKPTDKKDPWEEDKDFDEGEVKKLAVGESIEGLYQDAVRSHKYQCMCYKIKEKDQQIPKVILSTTILEKMMENRLSFKAKLRLSKRQK